MLNDCKQLANSTKPSTSTTYTLVDAHCGTDGIHVVSHMHACLLVRAPLHAPCLGNIISRSARLASEICKTVTCVSSVWEVTTFACMRCATDKGATVQAGVDACMQDAWLWQRTPAPCQPLSPCALSHQPVGCVDTWAQLLHAYAHATLSHARKFWPMLLTHTHTHTHTQTHTHLVDDKVCLASHWVN